MIRGVGFILLVALAWSGAAAPPHDGRPHAASGGAASFGGTAASSVRPDAGRGVAPDSVLTITRLQYEGGGDWYANPSSLPNLLTAIRERTGLPVAARPQTVRPLDPTLQDHPYLYMTGHGNVRFSPEERTALREYFLAGGFLHADDNYGMDESFREEIAAIFPEYELVEIPPDQAVFRMMYDFPEGLPKIHEHDGAPPRPSASSTAGAWWCSTATSRISVMAGRIPTSMATLPMSANRRSVWA